MSGRYGLLRAYTREFYISQIIEESALKRGLETKRPSVPRGFIPELDGLRAVGVLLVILNHMWPWENAYHTLFLLLQLPWMLMDGFFVLSGWLITGILLDTRERSDYLRSFYVRRALRILPIYYAVLIFVVGIAVLNGHQAYKEMLANWGSPFWFFIFLGNFPTAITGRWPLGGGGSLVPLWSLQIEEQFYLIWPFLVRRMRLEILTRVLFGLCVMSTALRLFFYWRYPGNELIQCVLLPCHLEGLAMGSWLAIRFRQRAWIIDKKILNATVLLLGALSIGTAIASGYLNVTPFNRTIGYLIAPAWFTSIILWMIVYRGARASAFFRMPALVYVGKISYAAYLLHWPVANLIASAARFAGMERFNNGIIRLTLIFGLTIGLSALSWRWFEKPLFLLKDRLFPDARLPRPV